MIPNGRTLLLKGMKKNKNFFWNTEFIKLINQKICPYCNDSLIVKGIFKQCRCSFYLLGAPETLAYSKISVKAPEHNYNYGDGNTSFICEECGNTDLKKDRKHAEVVCDICGLIIQGPPGYAGLKHISYDSFKGVNND